VIRVVVCKDFHPEGRCVRADFPPTPLSLNHRSMTFELADRRRNWRLKVRARSRVHLLCNVPHLVLMIRIRSKDRDEIDRSSTANEANRTLVLSILARAFRETIFLAGIAICHGRRVPRLETRLKRVSALREARGWRVSRDASRESR